MILLLILLKLLEKFQENWMNKKIQINTIQTRFNLNTLTVDLQPLGFESVEQFVHWTAIQRSVNKKIYSQKKIDGVRVVILNKNSSKWVKTQLNRSIAVLLIS